MCLIISLTYYNARLTWHQPLSKSKLNRITAFWTVALCIPGWMLGAYRSIEPFNPAKLFRLSPQTVLLRWPNSQKSQELRSGERAEQEVEKFRFIICSCLKCCLNNCAIYVLICGRSSSCLRIAVSKMSCCWSSFITKHLNIDSMLVVVTVHITGPAVDCPSKKLFQLWN